MKSSKFIALMCVLLFFSACRKAVHYPKTRTVVMGKVLHPEVYPTTKFFTISIIDFRGGSPHYEGKINADGTFKIVFDLYGAQDVDMQPIVDDLFLQPGDSIFLTVDFSDIANVHQRGDHQKDHRDFKRFVEGNFSINGFKAILQSEGSVEERRLELDKELEKMEAKWERFEDERHPDKLVEKWTRNYIKIEYYNALFRLAEQSAKSEGLRYEEWVAPDNYFTFVRDLNELFVGDVINSESYTFLLKYVHLHVMRYADTSLRNSFSENEYLRLVELAYGNYPLGQVLKGLYLSQMLSLNNLDKFIAHQEIFKDIYIPYIKESIRSEYERKVFQKEHPDLETKRILSELSERDSSNIFQHVLAKHKDKTMLIVCWRASDFSFKRSQSFYKRLMDEHADKAFDVVFLCMNSNHNRWNQVLSELYIGGDHYYLNKVQSKAMQRSFSNDHTHLSILINSQGVIEEYGPHMMLDSESLKKKISTLLQN